MGYMLDTNIFNRLVEGRLAIGDLPGVDEFFATSIQIQELNATRNIERRAILINKFSEVSPKLDSIKTSLWGYASYGESAWGAEGEHFAKIKSELDLLNNNKASNPADALIGEVSLSNHHTLMTTDKDLAAVVEKMGGKVMQISC
jgi:predicted nucleic acid-binding protein